MKLIFTLPVVAGVYFSVLAIQPFTVDTTEKNKSLTITVPEEKKPVKKSRSSRNNNVVRIYPGIFKRVMHVVADEDLQQPIDFFVFDLQGTLMQHYKMKAGDRKKLNKLEKGKYVYNVFSGDEEAANGQFEMR